MLCPLAKPRLKNINTTKIGFGDPFSHKKTPKRTPICGFHTGSVEHAVFHKNIKNAPPWTPPPRGRKKDPQKNAKMIHEGAPRGPPTLRVLLGFSRARGPPTSTRQTQKASGNLFPRSERDDHLFHEERLTRARPPEEAFILQKPAPERRRDSTKATALNPEPPMYHKLDAYLGGQV